MISASTIFTWGLFCNRSLLGCGLLLCPLCSSRGSARPMFYLPCLLASSILACLACMVCGILCMGVSRGLLFLWLLRWQVLSHSRTLLCWTLPSLSISLSLIFRTSFLLSFFFLCFTVTFFLACFFGVSTSISPSSILRFFSILLVMYATFVPFVSSSSLSVSCRCSFCSWLNHPFLRLPNSSSACFL